MAREDYEVQVRVERHTGTTTDSGGEITASETIGSGLYPTKHFHSAQRLRREEGNFFASGPGLQTVTEVFFKFNSPFPDIQPNDLIIEVVSGLKWRVQWPRKYSRTMQVDVIHVSTSGNEALTE